MLFTFNVNTEEEKEETKYHNQDEGSMEKENIAQLKSDLLEFKYSKFFKKEVSKEEVMRNLFEVIVHANNIIKITGENETFNSIEMSLNKHHVLLDKSKVLIVKMNSLILMIPVKISRIEVKLRNVFFINEQPHISALSTFVEFFLDTYLA